MTAKARIRHVLWLLERATTAEEAFAGMLAEVRELREAYRRELASNGKLRDEVAAARRQAQETTGTQADVANLTARLQRSEGQLEEANRLSAESEASEYAPTAAAAPPPTS